jgi:hypothetical protein
VPFRHSRGGDSADRTHPWTVDDTRPTAPRSRPADMTVVTVREGIGAEATADRLLASATRVGHVDDAALSLIRRTGHHGDCV